MQLPATVEIKGIRVLTSKQLAECYESTPVRIKQNFNENRNRFVDGKHYISLTGDELKAFKKQVGNSYLVANRASHLYLWTEKGALLHAKSLNTDKAWEVYDYLVDFYFRANEKVEVKPEPVKKPSGREVVDVPENVEMQKAITEVRKYIIALEVIVNELNKYCCEGNYRHLRNSMDILWTGLGMKIVTLENIDPNIIKKNI